MECHINALDDVELDWRQLDDGRFVVTWADRVKLTITPSTGCTMNYEDVSAGAGTVMRIYQSQSRPTKSQPNQAIRRSQSRIKNPDRHLSKRVASIADTQDKRGTEPLPRSSPVKRKKVCAKGKSREPPASTLIAVPDQQLSISDLGTVQTLDPSDISRFTQVVKQLNSKSASTMSCLRGEIAHWRSNKMEYWGISTEKAFLNWVAQGLESRNSEKGRLSQVVRLYHWFHLTRHFSQEQKLQTLCPGYDENASFEGAAAVKSRLVSRASKYNVAGEMLDLLRNVGAPQSLIVGYLMGLDQYAIFRSFLNAYADPSRREEVLRNLSAALGQMVTGLQELTAEFEGDAKQIFDDIPVKFTTWIHEGSQAMSTPMIVSDHHTSLQTPDVEQIWSQTGPKPVCTQHDDARMTAQHQEAEFAPAAAQYDPTLTQTLYVRPADLLRGAEPDSEPSISGALRWVHG